ncbi:hypothetical protein LGQ02_16925 [Bacillus shivajii]|uniref:hypothetical protein n=1 Tax=Bacillus shivajii TaxID=1983719 RepID=UPI001CF92F54|nr:hypothetical protein [Bacillus shivajii]UCZ52503.1 hypothetical protein LGQ02_16925 [Bacillus shivajii]
MRDKVFRWFIISILIFSQFLFVPKGVEAGLEVTNDQLPYEEVGIQVMPEYVTPESWESEERAMLIGYHGLIRNDTGSTYIGDLSVVVPANETNFFVALIGEYSDEGDVQDVDFDLDEENGLVTWQPNQPIDENGTYRFVIEYYYSPFVEGDNHHVSFDFSTNFQRPVEQGGVMFMVPYAAENFTINEEADQISDMFGVPVHAFEFNQLSTEQQIEFETSYEREKGMLSTLEALETQSPPDDDVHAGLVNNAQQPPTGNSELISTENAVMISLSVVIAGLFVFLGLRGYKRTALISGDEGLRKDKKTKRENIELEKKRLKKQFINGDIDEKTYRSKLSNLS